MRDNGTVAFVIMCTALCFFYLGRQTAPAASPPAAAPPEVCDALDNDCAGTAGPEDGDVAYLTDASGSMALPLAAIAEALKAAAEAAPEEEPSSPAPTIIILQLFVCPEEPMPVFPQNDGTTVHEI